MGIDIVSCPILYARVGQETKIKQGGLKRGMWVDRDRRHKVQHKEAKQQARRKRPHSEMLRRPSRQTDAGGQPQSVQEN